MNPCVVLSLWFVWRPQPRPSTLEIGELPSRIPSGRGNNFEHLAGFRGPVCRLTRSGVRRQARPLAELWFSRKWGVCSFCCHRSGVRSGPLCSGFDSLFGTLRSSDPGLGETITAIKRCGEFGSILRAALGKCEVVSLSDGSGVADGDSLLPVLIAERVVDYTWLPSHFIPLAFRLVWGGEEEFRPLNDESTLEGADAPG